MFTRRRMRLRPSRIVEFWNNRKDIRAATRIASLFDADFYLKYNPDVRESGLEPALHWIKYGWKEGRDPSATFSTKTYVAECTDFENGNLDPLSHFLRFGDRRTGARQMSLEAEKSVIAAEFDAEFYLNKYKDVGFSGVTPIEFYCSKGWQKGHDPCPDFSTSHYLTTNPDVRESGVNPFWHYIVAGREEGRSPKPRGGWQSRKVKQIQPLEKSQKPWTKTTPPPPLLSAQALANVLTENQIGHHRIVSIGHDDYRTTAGGVQLCIGLEACLAGSKRIDYVNLHPWQPLPTLASQDSDPTVCVVLNNNSLGHAAMSDVAEAISIAGSGETELVIHHLSGHSVEAVLSLAKRLSIQRCKFWLHDHFSMCTSFALQRNDVANCGAPDARSNACKMCIYGDERKRQFARFLALFEALEVDLLSPSKFTLDFWTDRSNLPAASGRVLPHMTLNAIKRSRPTAATKNTPCRIAFVGYPAPHKGWPVFEGVLDRLATDPRYEFFVFCSSDVDRSGVTHVPIHAKPSNPTHTIDKLAEHQIDLVVHWANCYETFSFTTYEAMAAGCFVVTNTESGNVAAAVNSHTAGVVLPSQDALMKLAEDGGFLRLAQQARNRRTFYETTAHFGAFSLTETLDGEQAA